MLASEGWIGRSGPRHAIAVEVVTAWHQRGRPDAERRLLCRFLRRLRDEATLGSGDRLEYTVIGEAANLAAKLEKHNKAVVTRALTPAATYELAVAQGYAAGREPEYRRSSLVAGVSDPLDLVVLKS